MKQVIDFIMKKRFNIFDIIVLTILTSIFDVHGWGVFIVALFAFAGFSVYADVKYEETKGNE